MNLFFLDLLRGGSRFRRLDYYSLINIHLLGLFNCGIKIGWLCEYNLIDFDSLRDFSDFSCLDVINEGCLDVVPLLCLFKFGERFWSLNHNFLIEFNFFDFLRRRNMLSWLYKD